MNTNAKLILKGVLDAMQEAEECGAVTTPEYVKLMFAISKESTSRFRTAKQLICEHKSIATMNLPHLGRYCLDCDKGGV